MTSLVIRHEEQWVEQPQHLRDWLNGGMARWKAEVGEDLMGGYARLIYLEGR